METGRSANFTRDQFMSNPLQVNFLSRNIKRNLLYQMSYLIIIMFTCKHNCVFRRDWEPSRIPEGTLKCLRRKGRKVKEYVYECIRPSIPKFSWLHCYVKCCSKRTSRLDEGEKCQPNQGICYRDITLINLVNCKRIKKGTYIIDCIQLNTWRLNSVNESNIIKELINEPNATANTKYIYK